jgi:hypothetical protein
MQNFSASPREMAASLWRNKGLIRNLVHREVVGRYKGSSWCAWCAAQCLRGGGHPKKLTHLWPMGRCRSDRRQPQTILGATGLCPRLCGLVRHRRLLVQNHQLLRPAHKRCIAWKDPAIGITWPQGMPPQLSAKDQAGKLLAQAEVFA